MSPIFFLSHMEVSWSRILSLQQTHKKDRQQQAAAAAAAA
jgi:hypothetical protein